MNLKRTVYHIAGKDYEANAVITYAFNLQRVSIQNFLAIQLPFNRTVRNYVASYSAYYNDHQHTTTDGIMKTFTVRCSAAILFCIFEQLGIKEWNSIENMELNVRKGELRAYDGHKSQQYAGIHVFDPSTKKMWLTTGTPRKIKGNQAIINGKLWRKYISQPI